MQHALSNPAPSSGYLRRLTTLFGCAAALFLSHSIPVSSAASALLAQGGGAPRDPALTVGTLPNGFRYYLRQNSNPKQRAELRLVVNAGSLLEDDDQRGFAHLLEHMAFNGTKSFPGNSVIDFVESAGMSFGAHLNAYTSYDETVYMLTIPTDDPAILDKGMLMLEEWASGRITIDSNEVVAERGVVLSEWRTRLADTAVQNMFNHKQAVLYGKGSRHLERLPIGTPESLAGANPGALKRFYTDWYRPDMMAFVAVGDFDAAQLEARIRERFGRIPASANPRPRLNPTLPNREEPVVDVYRGPFSPSLSIYWPQPPRATEVRAAYREGLIEHLLFDDLQHTLLKLREQPRRPFMHATVGAAGDAGRALGRLYALSLVATPDSLESGLEAVLTEIEQIARDGIPKPRLEERKAALLRRLESAAAAEPSSAQLAGEYARHYLTGEGTLLSRAQQLELAREILREIGPNDLARAASFWRDEEKRLVLIDLPTFASARPPTLESVRAITRAVANAPRSKIDASAKVASANSPLLRKPPKPGKVVSEQRHARAGITEWKLSNGARVLYKPTDFHSDELFIRARAMGGSSLLPDTLFFSPGRLVGDFMTAAAGLGDSDRDALQRQLAVSGVRDLRVSINHTDQEIALAGSPRELETLFQMLYLQFTAPKLDTAVLEAWKLYGASTLRQSANDQLARTFYMRGNRRLAPPSPALVQLMELDQAMAVYRHRFGDASQFTFVIVGAAKPERVKPLVERYLASLPSTGRAEREQPKDPGTPVWTSNSRSFNERGTLPRASLHVVFDSIFTTEPQEYARERQRLTTLTWVIHRRLRERLREERGMTYSPVAQSQMYTSPKEHFRISIQADAAPEDIDEVETVVDQVLDSLRSHGATASELATVAAIQQRSLQTQLLSNQYWLGAIQQHDRLSVPLDQIVDSHPDVLTPADIRAAAQRYLPRNAFMKQIVIPERKEEDKAEES